jgi:hypothetical protein
MYTDKEHEQIAHIQYVCVCLCVCVCVCVYVLNLIDIETTRIVREEHQLCVYSISHMCSHIYVCVEYIVARNINTSLSALLGVIKALASKSKHVPFRDSKLTHPLSFSLSGDGKVFMYDLVYICILHISYICCTVTPS